MRPQCLLAAAVALSVLGGADPSLANRINTGEEAGTYQARFCPELAKHLDKLSKAKQEVRELYELLAKQKGPKAKEWIEEAIKKLQKAIKGHEKEVRQKWPEYCPRKDK